MQAIYIHLSPTSQCIRFACVENVVGKNDQNMSETNIGSKRCILSQTVWAGRAGEEKVCVLCVIAQRLWWRKPTRPTVGSNGPSVWIQAPRPLPFLKPKKVRKNDDKDGPDAVICAYNSKCYFEVLAGIEYTCVCLKWREQACFNRGELQSLLVSTDSRKHCNIAMQPDQINRRMGVGNSSVHTSCKKWSL